MIYCQRPSMKHSEYADYITVKAMTWNHNENHQAEKKVTSTYIWVLIPAHVPVILPLKTTGAWCNARHSAAKRHHVLCGGSGGRDVQGISNTTGVYGGIICARMTKMCRLKWILVASFAFIFSQFLTHLPWAMVQYTNESGVWYRIRYGATRALESKTTSRVPTSKPERAQNIVVIRETHTLEISLRLNKRTNCASPKIPIKHVTLFN